MRHKEKSTTGPLQGLSAVEIGGLGPVCAMASSVLGPNIRVSRLKEPRWCRRDFSARAKRLRVACRVPSQCHGTRRDRGRNVSATQHTIDLHAHDGFCQNCPPEFELDVVSLTNHANVRGYFVDIEEINRPTRAPKFSRTWANVDGATSAAKRAPHRNATRLGEVIRLDNKSRRGYTGPIVVVKL